MPGVQEQRGGPIGHNPKGWVSQWGNSCLHFFFGANTIPSFKLFVARHHSGLKDRAWDKIQGHNDMCYLRFISAMFKASTIESAATI